MKKLLLIVMCLLVIVPVIASAGDPQTISYVIVCDGGPYDLTVSYLDADSFEPVETLVSVKDRCTDYSGVVAVPTDQGRIVSINVEGTMLGLFAIVTQTATVSQSAMFTGGGTIWIMTNE